ncbi:hypothetical protein GCM10010468_23600 [Actinocorallia longicatena]|uniref:Uncharacterized protein n=1 Tax=Actinocorallia longicatena TaxID=111803 RepID=A0ABP6Q799_9ACTN
MVVDGSVDLDMGEVGEGPVLEELRPAGHVAERVRTLDGGADDGEVRGALVLEVLAVDRVDACHQTCASRLRAGEAARRTAAAVRMALTIGS